MMINNMASVKAAQFYSAGKTAVINTLGYGWSLVPGHAKIAAVAGAIFAKLSVIPGVKFLAAHSFEIGLAVALALAARKVYACYFAQTEPADKPDSDTESSAKAASKTQPGAKLAGH